MKILFASGEEYSAMFIRDEFGIERAFNWAKNNGGSCVIEDEHNYAEIKILEFGDVDEKFLDFLRKEVVGYDQSKHKDFFIIED